MALHVCTNTHAQSTEKNEKLLRVNARAILSTSQPEYIILLMQARRNVTFVLRALTL